MITKLDKNATRKKRHARVRAKLSGTAARPRPGTRPPTPSATGRGRRRPGPARSPAAPAAA